MSLQFKSYYILKTLFVISRLLKTRLQIYECIINKRSLPSAHMLSEVERQFLRQVGRKIIFIGWRK